VEPLPAKAVAIPAAEDHEPEARERLLPVDARADREVLVEHQGLDPRGLARLFGGSVANDDILGGRIRLDPLPDRSGPPLTNGFRLPGKGLRGSDGARHSGAKRDRSEERRVGKEGRSRWWAKH